ncbi:MAG: phosphonopyruvate decarboxylase [Ectothiorhodospiraceae bacterium]|nr:phosphonopyruvate decarboxylase [Chromatiales bacterium]MCP5157659.1 phosphonopyruvate decarboxylase [Ectothiorhodospiraceae bacterium]
MAAQPARDAWRDDLHGTLRSLDIRQVVYVPDAGHARLIDRCLADPELSTGALTNEFEGVGMCVGAWLGGQRAVMLMQSSGVGNVVNALGLAQSCGCPFFTVVTMRGEWGEFNPWQIPPGQSAPRVLEAAGVVVHRVTDPALVCDTVAAAGRLAFQSYIPVAVLISQQVTGAKVFK